MDDLTFGWFLPTSGDSTCLADPDQRIAQSSEMFEEVVTAADEGGFKYLLMPVNATCWEATVTASFYAARSKKIAPLIALRSGYCNPSLSAKMYATLDQLTGGRLCINLIAGISDADTQADGISDNKQVRYEKMDEEVEIMKRLWASDEPIGFEGKHYNVNQVIQPKPLQQPHPPFFLGGGSDQAKEISAKHSTIHLFWGDKPEVIADNIKDMRRRAAKYGREEALGFGMRLQIVCAESENEAWNDAHKLVAGAKKFQLFNSNKGQAGVESIRKTSEANQRVWQLLEESGDEMKIHPHLWTGISMVRSGAGIAVVGTPKQIADTLDEFVEAGCSSFCLSGYPHAKAARLFSTKVMPHFKGRMSEGLPRAA